MATPRQIATLLGLCAVSFGLFYASSLAEEQPIVLWGESAETTMAQKPAPDGAADAGLPAATPSTAGGHQPAAAKPTKPAPGAAQPAAKASVAAAAKPGSKASAAAARPETKPGAAAAKPAAVAAKPSASAKPAAKPAPAKPSAAPVAAATPAPAKPAAVAAKPAAPASGPVNAVPMNPVGGRIPASTPERLAAMARQSAGRVDPFVSLELPSASTAAIPAPTSKIPTPPAGKATLPKPSATPQPTPGDGMVVTGIITSAKESVAIVAAEGRSRLVQVGDILPGGIRVVSIKPEGKAVIVSHGGRSARLAVKE
jgi:hypothetical protein